MFWYWNLPLKKAANPSQGTIGEVFDLAKVLGVSGENLSHARIVAFSDKAPTIKAGSADLTNPWLNPDRSRPSETDGILSDLQVHRRWADGHLVAYIRKAKEITV